MSWRAKAGLVQGAATRTFGDSVGGTGLVRYKPAPPLAEIGGVHGVFRAEHLALTSGQEADLTTAAPTLDVRLSDIGMTIPLSHANQDQLADSTWEIPDGGAVYTVVDVQPDGEGMVALVLQEVANT